MRTFATLLSICAIAAGSYALLPPRADSAVCVGAQAISTSSIVVNGKNVELTTFSCGASAHANDGHSFARSNVCGDSGNLPPTTEDCATIMDAITILNGSISPSFSVDSGHVQTLAFGTCRFFFQNFSPFPMSNCWLAFGQTASAAASACLPPVQPVNSEGLCVAPDASWRVG
ncbi:hypothetical protein BV20DRAFT_1039797 [Pilatotrama ljubarskyi]|nr:hypothetical protein BV20DRAFT_1039797 [Pilatotrama ljubarskyi]